GEHAAKAIVRCAECLSVRDDEPLCLVLFIKVATVNDGKSVFLFHPLADAHCLCWLVAYSDVYTVWAETRDNDGIFVNSWTFPVLITKVTSWSGVYPDVEWSGVRGICAGSCGRC